MRRVKPTGGLVQGFGASLVVVMLTACSGGGGGGSSTTTVTASSVAGSYVFAVTGTDPTDGDYSAVGSFVTDGKGNITSATADYNLGAGTDNNVPLTGTYTVAGSTLSVSLTDGVGTQDTFTSNLSSTGTSPISNFDSGGSGMLYKQTLGGFKLPGTYSFSITGEGQGTVTGSGQFVAGASGAFTGGNLTYADEMTAESYSTVTGFLDTPQTTSGRGFASLQGIDLAYYVVGPNQIQMMGLDNWALLNIPAKRQ